MALLHFFYRCSKDYKTLNLEVCHIDHGLRVDTYWDRELVEDYCRSKNIPVINKTLDPHTKPVGESVEMWGRRNRYQIFEKLSSRYCFDYVLTAHHLNDQIETLIMRLQRGTGIDGLMGVHFYRKPNLLRPFLFWPKEELVRFLSHHEISWREDYSNKDVKFRRNWVRQNFLQKLGEDDPLYFCAGRISWLAKQLQLPVETLELDLLETQPDGQIYLPKKIWSQARKFQNFY